MKWIVNKNKLNWLICSFVIAVRVMLVGGYVSCNKENNVPTNPSPTSSPGPSPSTSSTSPASLKKKVSNYI